jgi:hypothetical protein
MEIGVMGSRWFISVVCAALAVGLSVAPCHGVPAERETSDVGLIQGIVADVFSEDAPNAASDVNGDGQIDILDFQQALDLATQADSGKESPLQDSTPRSCYFSYQTLVLAKLDCQKTAELLDRPQTPRPRTFDHADRRIATSETERYLFQLTPNAPPSHA